MLGADQSRAVVAMLVDVKLVARRAAARRQTAPCDRRPPLVLAHVPDETRRQAGPDLSSLMSSGKLIAGDAPIRFWRDAVGLVIMLITG